MVKLVKFEDGKFGIRRGFIVYQYRDLQHPEYWWHSSGKFFPSCKGTIEQCKALMDNHEVIK